MRKTPRHATAIPDGAVTAHPWFSGRPWLDDEWHRVHIAAGTERVSRRGECLGPLRGAARKLDPIVALASRLPREDIAVWRQEGRPQHWILTRLTSLLSANRFRVEKALRLLDEEAA